MGFGALWFLWGIGVAAGQISFLAIFGFWFGLTGVPQRWLSSLVEQSVRAGIRELLEIDVTTTTTSAPPTLLVARHWNRFSWILYWVDVEFPDCGACYYIAGGGVWLSV